MESKRLPLDGVRVLDLGRFLAAPYCGQLLADLGADVIRIEDPEGGDDRKIGQMAPNGDSVTFVARNRNKRAISLNIQTSKGRAILDRLIAKSDILVENFSAVTRQKLGMEYEQVRRANRAIIQVSMTAFGLDGPYANRDGFDPIIQAMSGSMACTGFPSSPPLRAAVSWVDFSSGLHCAVGCLAALRYREKYGVGQRIDVSLFDCASMMMMLFGIHGEYELHKVIRPKLGNCTAYAYSDCFEAKDGWVFISAISNRVWQRFARTVGREELVNSPDYCDDAHRVTHREAINNIVKPWVLERSVAEVASLMEKARVPCARVNEIPEAVNDPQVAARGMLIRMPQHDGSVVPVAGPVVKFSETPLRIDRWSPAIGENNREVFGRMLGMKDEEIARLREEKVI